MCLLEAVGACFCRGLDETELHKVHEKRPSRLRSTQLFYIHLQYGEKGGMSPPSAKIRPPSPYKAKYKRIMNKNVEYIPNPSKDRVHLAYIEIDGQNFTCSSALAVILKSFWSHAQLEKILRILKK